jgi:hypothetical protein
METTNGDAMASGKRESKSKNMNQGAGMAGGAYFFGFLGAIVYYIQTATGFWDGAFGVFKALFWPAFLVYELLGHLAA